MDRKEFINRLFERARQRAGDTADFACEACWSRGESFEAEVKNGELYQYNVSEGGGMGFRALVNGRMGYASTQILDEDAIDLLVDGVLENAALVESEDRQFLFAGSERYAELKQFEPRLEAIDAAQKIAMARELERLALAQDERIVQVEGCSVFSASDETAIVNTLGLDVSSRVNLLGGYVAVVAREGEKVNTGFKAFFTMDPDVIDLESVARIAARRALDGLDASQAPSGSYPVVLQNDVAATLLDTFSGVFSADNAQRGLSRLKGREGEAIAADCVTLMDDPHRQGSISSTPFDGEGVATAPKAVIDGGRLTTLLHNLKTAYKQGVATTANASRSGKASAVGVAPTNFFFKPSGDAPEALLARLGDGLLITELQGMHAGANAVTGDFSLAAKGFMVKQGQVAGAVNQITVAGNFYDLLMDIEAVGSDLEFLPPSISCFGSPSLLVKRLSVAGS